MSVREIRTASPDAAIACDVCGRTLLRGERSHAFLEGVARRVVCELCVGRAAREGWVREGTLPSYDRGDAARHRRRSLLARLRRPHREAMRPVEREVPPDLSVEPEGERLQEPRRVLPRRRARPRHVRAVPTGLAQRMAAAVDAFNASEHPRTVAGVARSLGLPAVAIVPDQLHPGLLRLTIAWELCWYRYEVDLAEEEEAVRLSDQGAELHELSSAELEPNARCDADGLLALEA